MKTIKTLARLALLTKRAGEFACACLIPGRFEAGMVGQIDVGPR